MGKVRDMNREELLRELDEALDSGDVILAKALSKKLQTMPEGNVVTKKKRKIPGQTTNINWKNNFQDDGREHANERISLQKVTDVGGKLINEEGVTVALQIKTGVRSPYEEVSVVCSNCHKNYSVNPIIAVQSTDLKGSTFRCNDCCSG